MNSDGIIDHDAIRENKEMKEKAEALIAEESNKFKIYSYRAIVLRLEVIEQYNLVEKSLQVCADETVVPYM